MDEPVDGPPPGRFCLLKSRSLSLKLAGKGDLCRAGGTGGGAMGAIGSGVSLTGAAATGGSGVGVTGAGSSGCVMTGELCG